ncbi:TPA: hypothetical protein QCQ73_004349 [Bacillus cereus]|uniref:Uncharacterized protein n=1 Tax=Bacillus cereus (strain ATCC 10987 / NRS 248) TaxID=222523 RepID=Q73D57_BACC1|nr:MULTISPECIES: hypothetical protein [Bacillus cereus group]AAS39788.1 hypothetical protein BCE_0857 [Bacillus cereus ATCC 10987]AIE81575.1 Serine phosphatase RsbU, regulator of sigma subunit [Bacillus cereus]MDK7479008.1 hypothetical protein [Bacillus cereus]MDR4261116.1 hypothetical protein [Bacillus pacificus]HDR4577972.1 hypothetical protein [Bacillus cereus]
MVKSKSDFSQYDNIFHYFRGGSREQKNDLQIENNVTKALINVLQHSSFVLTKNLISFLGFQVQGSEYDYRVQISSQLSEVTKIGVILGIAESNHVIKNNQIMNIKSGVPDAAILSKEISLLIEVKTGANSYLSYNQLNRHKGKFSSEQLINEAVKIITWDELRVFFRKQQNYFEGESITCFLLKQFEEFCEINGVGKKTKEHYFLHFNPRTRALAREIDEFIWKGSGFDTIDPNSTKGIGYKRKGRRGGFGKLCIGRKCLILRYGSDGDPIGEQFQKEIDSCLGRTYLRSNTDDKKYPHEAFVNLDWVENVEQIKPYIIKAYELKP